jgi:glyoxylase-like metal-dependent hydrolase (beta-lactamase superfamily II)
MVHRRTGSISRRTLIADLGSLGIGLAVIAACGSSDGDASDASGSDAPETDPTAALPETTAPNAVAPASSADVDDGTALSWEHVSFGFVSAFVLVRGGEAAVVDTGAPDGGASILEGLSTLGASWSDVRHVVLTHKHDDHVGGLADVIEEAPGAAVYAGEHDIARIRSSVPLRPVGDGDEIMGLGVVNTPGHTPGSISLFDTGTGLLVAGDAITGGDGRIRGPDAQFSEDIATATVSLATLAALEPDVAAFGHQGGPPITVDVAAQLAALAAG